MTETFIRTKKEPHGSAAWLKQRWALPNGDKLISASVAGVIYDCHPFISPAQLAAELLSDNPPTPQNQNEAMERGNRLEPVIMQWANDKLGKNFTTPDELFIYCDDNGARMIATLDGFDGTEVLEVKTTTRDWTGELPDYWKFQGIQQAICANVDFIQWAIFDKSQSLNLHRQFVSSDEKQEHIQAVRKWLTNIDLGMTPKGVAWTYDTISRKHPQETVEHIELGPAAAELVAQLRHVKSEAKSYADMEDRLKAELCELIGDAATATYNGEVLVTWKAQTRKALDQKALREAHPDLVDSYTKESTIRVLRLKGSN